MSNYLRIGDCKLPTAAYAKSLNLSSQEKKDLLKIYKNALRENHASNHQLKRFKVEEGRYIRSIRKEKGKKPQPSPTLLTSITTALYELPGRAFPFW